MKRSRLNKSHVSFYHALTQLEEPYSIPVRETGILMGFPMMPRLMVIVCKY